MKNLGREVLKLPQDDANYSGKVDEELHYWHDGRNHQRRQNHVEGKFGEKVEE